MQRYLVTGITALLLLAATPGISLATGESKTVYGWQLMTDQERTEHRAKMQGFNTEEEREAYRREHHQRMQARAKEQGKTLPDEPWPQGKGLGMGPRDGTGAGSGAGQGRGRY